MRIVRTSTIVCLLGDTHTEALSQSCGCGQPLSLIHIWGVVAAAKRSAHYVPGLYGPSDAYLVDLPVWSWGLSLFGAGNLIWGLWLCFSSHKNLRRARECVETAKNRRGQADKAFADIHHAGQYQKLLAMRHAQSVRLSLIHI